MPVFRRSKDIFEHENILHDDYQPNNLEEREEELKQFKGYLQPVINGVQPRNIFLYGKTGVGKTAGTKHLLHHLEQDAQRYQDLNITTIYLNCEDLTSSYRVAVSLVNELRAPNDQISETGHPLNAIYDKLWQEIDEIGGSIIIVFDEIDYIGTDDSILYQIPRARSNDKIQNARIGLIGISNDFKFRETLDPRVEDTLCEREIHFPPYRADELENILQKRATMAFKSGVIADGAIPLCSALAAQDKGSARQALDILLEAGDFARRHSEPEVTISHIRDGKKALDKKHIEETMKDLTPHGHLTLCAMVTMAINCPEKIPTRRQLIYKRYENLADSTDREPLGGRSFHNHLSELSMFGILKRTKRNEGRGGGIYCVYQLDVPLEAALSSLDSLYISQELDLKELRSNAKSKNLINS